MVRFWVILACWVLVASPSTTEASPRRSPNIIFLLADDLGYGELGCYGQKKIRTPHLDQLARQGIRFTQHYSGNAVCAPSRCVLMTGRHPGHAWIRDNQEVQPEGQFPLRTTDLTVASLLQTRGYATGGFGKWGLGPMGSSGDPLQHGFDRFFGYNCQRVAHNYYPTSLWNNAERVLLRNSSFPSHQKLPPGADPANPKTYASFLGQDYAPDRIAEEARAFIRAQKDRPFFLYFPTTVPHLALQVPEDSVREYEGLWPDPPYPGDKSYLPNRTPRATYAAMISRLDGEVGRIIDLVRELDLEEDTIFIFTSDNGPTYGRLGGSDSDFFQSAGGLRGLKGSLYEGGIRVPLIVRWKGHIPEGRVSGRLCGFEDWLPTLLELSGNKTAIPRDVDGVSFAPTLLGRSQQPRPFLYREFPGYGGQQFVRVGPWKAIRQKLVTSRANPLPQTHTELYQITQDPGETTDVAALHPAVVRRLERIMRQQHRPSSNFPMPVLD